ALVHNDAELRFAVIEALCAIDPLASADPLAKRLATAPAFVRRNLGDVLPKLGTVAIGPLLKHAPNFGPAADGTPPDPSVQEQFVGVLTRIGRPDPDVLYHAAVGKEKAHLYQALALGQLGDPRAGQMLTKLLGSRHSAIRDRTLEALRDVGEAAVPAMVDVLLQKDAVTRDGVLEILVTIGGKGHLALEELLQAPDLEVRLQAAAALGRLGRLRPLVALLWPRTHDAVCKVIESGSKAKIDALCSLAVLRKATEEAIFFGKIGNKLRAVYYLQSLLVLLYPHEIIAVEDSRLGSVLTYGGSVLESLGPLRLSRLHPIARRILAEASNPAQMAPRPAKVPEGARTPAT
ncbi:MAG: hypothetical protein KGR26_10555, partial [Cyanobacteria bacterium REEB65]|nr:hypothetical protein [Cyanobacteria bacterium REEB65]